jgi:hypothetical protein
MERALRDAVATAIAAALTRRENVPALARLAEGLTRPPEAADAADRQAAAERAARALHVVERYWQAEGGRRDADAVERALTQAACLFEAGLFFEVHEILEAVWRTLEGEPRRFIQGLIQIAVAFHHLEAGNAAGARTLFAEGRAKIAPHVPEYRGVAVAELLADLEPWEHAARGAPKPDASAMPALRVRTTPPGRSTRG